MNPTSSKPSTVYLIRHAESENNARPVYERVSDPAITQRGRLQTEHLAQWMKTLSLDLLVTSPFRRTLQTAKGILNLRDRSVEVWHDIFESGGCYHGHHEANFRGADGFNKDQIESLLHDGSTAGSASATKNIVIDQEIGSTGWWNGRDRETPEQSLTRAMRVADRLTETFSGSGQAVALVIHADFKRELLRVLLKDVLDLDLVGPIANTSVTELSLGSRWQLATLNSVTHLPPRLITGREH